MLVNAFLGVGGVGVRFSHCCYLNGSFFIICIYSD